MRIISSAYADIKLFLLDICTLIRYLTKFKELQLFLSCAHLLRPIPNLVVIEDLGRYFEKFVSGILIINHSVLFSAFICFGSDVPQQEVLRTAALIRRAYDLCNR